MTKKIVLITGASSGIGRALACVYAAKGNNLLLIGQDQIALQQTVDQCRQYPVWVDSLAQNFEDPTAVTQIIGHIEKANYVIEILINNAGLGHHGDFAQMDIARIQSLLLVNVYAVMNLTRLLLPRMLAQGEGHIVNIASVYAYVAVPHQIVYAATKAFIKSFSLGLAAEIKSKGIQVTCVCPGSTQTGFHARMNIHAKSKHFILSAETVAQMIYAGVKSRRLLVITGWYNRLFIFFVQRLPSRILPWVINYLSYRLRKIA